MSYRLTTVLSILAICCGSLAAQEKTSVKAGAASQKKAKANERTRQSKTDGWKLTTSAGARADKKSNLSTLSGLDAKQQSAAMAFAKANHPELVPLINQLKKKRSNGYKRALRDLHSAAERFGRLKERVTAERYERQLTLWKLDSRIRLQLAKWSVAKDETLAAEIKADLAKRQSIQRQQHEEELARLKERQARLEALMGGMTSEKLDTEWQRLSRSVGRNRQTRAKTEKRKSADQKKKDKKQKSNDKP